MQYFLTLYVQNNVDENKNGGNYENIVAFSYFSNIILYFLIHLEEENERH